MANQRCGSSAECPRSAGHRSENTALEGSTTPSYASSRSSRRRVLTVSTPPATPTRLTIVQPTIPSYRIPLFRSLAMTSGLRVVVRAGMTSPGSPVTPESATSAEYVFKAAPTKRIAGFLYQPAQWTAAGDPDCDVLVLSWNTRYVLLIPALLRARRRRLPVILWGHGTSTKRNDSGARRWLRQAVARWATLCLVYGETASRELRRDRRLKRKVVVAPNALDQRPIRLERLRLAARPDVLDDFRQNESLGKCHIVLFVSRVEAGRRLDLLVRAMQQVVARDPLALLVIVGDGALVTGLRRLADEQGVGGKVRFVAGTYSEEILSRWFMVSRVFVAPEALGLNVLHAFGYGLPVITSDNARVHSPEFEYLRPGVNGLLYRAGSPQQLATQILKILDSDSLQSKLASGARATVAGNGVTMPRMVQAFAAAVRLASDGLPTNPAITQAPT